MLELVLWYGLRSSQLAIHLIFLMAAGKTDPKSKCEQDIYPLLLKCYRISVKSTL